jgi:hypothetical protein
MESYYHFLQKKKTSFFYNKNYLIITSIKIKSLYLYQPKAPPTIRFLATNLHNKTLQEHKTMHINDVDA